MPDTPIDLIARKAIARGVSDIAAMGGSPTWALAAAKLPAAYAHADELFERCAHWALHWGCPLVGGDIASSDFELALSITVAGRTHPTRGPVLRSGAKAGDLVGVTGPIGDSFVSGWHLTFQPRLSEARALCGELGTDLHAMIDISDGLGLDAERLASASGVVIEIAEERVPRRDGSSAPWQELFAHGEDHELLVTFAPSAPPPRLLSVIGTVRRTEPGETPGAWVVLPGQDRFPCSSMGWDHT